MLQHLRTIILQELLGMLTLKKELEQPKHWMMQEFYIQNEQTDLHQRAEIMYNSILLKTDSLLKELLWRKLTEIARLGLC